MRRSPSVCSRLRAEMVWRQSESRRPIERDQHCQIHFVPTHSLTLQILGRTVSRGSDSGLGHVSTAPWSLGWVETGKGMGECSQSMLGLWHRGVCLVFTRQQKRRWLAVLRCSVCVCAPLLTVWAEQRRDCPPECSLCQVACLRVYEKLRLKLENTHMVRVCGRGVCLPRPVFSPYSAVCLVSTHLPICLLTNVQK